MCADALAAEHVMGRIGTGPVVLRRRRLHQAGERRGVGRFGVDGGHIRLVDVLTVDDALLGDVRDRPRLGEYFEHALIAGGDRASVCGQPRSEFDGAFDDAFLVKDAVPVRLDRRTPIDGRLEGGLIGI
jgi:hypothetical protein